MIHMTVLISLSACLNLFILFLSLSFGETFLCSPLVSCLCACCDVHLSSACGSIRRVFSAPPLAATTATQSMPACCAAHRCSMTLDCLSTPHFPLCVLRLSLAASSSSSLSASCSTHLSFSDTTKLLFTEQRGHSNVLSTIY